MYLCYLWRCAGWFRNRLPQTYSFTPSLDTQANRAYDKAANIATKVQSAYDMALSADGIAKGTRTTLD
jgi:hypothetical protein